MQLVVISQLYITIYHTPLNTKYWINMRLFAEFIIYFTYYISSTYAMDLPLKSQELAFSESRETQDDGSNDYKKGTIIF